MQIMVGKRSFEIPKRRYSKDVELSILGFGGMLLVETDQKSSSALVAESFERGINYFDVAPFYGSGEAEKKLGIALEPYRRRAFLACKTLERDAAGAAAELERSLRRLRTDCFDLYQHHAVTTTDEVDRIFASGGAAEAFFRAREQGKIRFMGFSAHSVPAALAMMDRFDFDSLLFPVNFVCYAQGNFGPQVLKRARERHVARLALKALALRPWRRGEERKYPKCWYRPVEDRDLALKALRFTLSEDVTAAIPPGDERLFRMCLELIPDLKPQKPKEREQLLDSAKGIAPLLRHRVSGARQ